MKKVCAVLLAAVVSGAATARDLYSSEEHPMTVFGLSFATPAQLPPANWTVKGLRCDILWGENFGVYGLDLGLAGLDHDNGAGVQLYGAAFWNEGDYYGLQASGLFNATLGNMMGAQFAGCVNYTRAECVGLQLAPVNYNGVFHGVQIGGYNYDKGICYAFQFGFANAAVNEYHGWSVGACNFAERFYGFQLGAINIARDFGRGVQIGLFNASDSYRGLQIGLLNLIGKGEVPIMPIMNAQF